MKPQDRTRAVLLSDVGLKPAARLVLIVLADCMSEGREYAFPKVETIATRAGMSVRTVQGVLKDGEAQGWLVKLKDTRIRSKKYAIGWAMLDSKAVQMARVLQALAEAFRAQNLRPYPAESAPRKNCAHTPQNLHPEPAEPAPKATKKRPGKRPAPPNPLASEGEHDLDQLDLSGGLRVALSRAGIRTVEDLFRHVGAVPEVSRRRSEELRASVSRQWPGLIEDLTDVGADPLPDVEAPSDLFDTQSEGLALVWLGFEPEGIGFLDVVTVEELAHEALPARRSWLAARVTHPEMVWHAIRQKRAADELGPRLVGK